MAIYLNKKFTSSSKVYQFMISYGIRTDRLTNNLIIMDLLGSILGNMEKPPTMDEKQRKQNKEHQKKIQAMKEKENNEKNKFRKDVDKKIENFIKAKDERKLTLPPMNKLERSIVHDVAEVAHLTSHAFGQEGEEGRYIIVFKKDDPPCEEELNAYRNGLEWDPNAVKIKANDTELNSEQTVKDIKPTFNYKDKYSHIIGKESAKEAAKKTEANKTFGLVPSANKRDLRSVEETMNELREKRRKIAENES